MRLLAISGSLRADSHNSRLLRIAAEEAPAGVEIEIYDGLAGIPPYDEDQDTGRGPAPVRELRERIAAADGLIFATPEYNSSIPGVLKNAIDWASRPRATTPLAGKPAAVMGASTGHFGAVWAQAELKKVLGSTGARVVDAEVVARARRRRLRLRRAGFATRQALDAIRDLTVSRRRRSRARPRTRSSRLALRPPAGAAARAIRRPRSPGSRPWQTPPRPRGARGGGAQRGPRQASPSASPTRTHHEKTRLPRTPSRTRSAPCSPTSQNPNSPPYDANPVSLRKSMPSLPTRSASSPSATCSGPVSPSWDATLFSLPSATAARAPLRAWSHGTAQAWAKHSRATGKVSGSINRSATPGAENNATTHAVHIVQRLPSRLSVRSVARSLPQPSPSASGSPAPAPPRASTRGFA